MKINKTLILLLLSFLNITNCNNFYFRSGNTGIRYVLSKTKNESGSYDFRIHKTNNRKPYEYLFKIDAEKLVIHPDHRYLTATTIDAENQTMISIFANTLWEQ
jgi:hypothetical protein